MEIYITNAVIQAFFTLFNSLGKKNIKYMAQETPTCLICLLQTHSYFQPFCLNCDRALLEKIKGGFSPKSDFALLQLLIDFSTQGNLNTIVLTPIPRWRMLCLPVPTQVHLWVDGSPVLSKHKVKMLLYDLISNNMLQTLMQHYGVMYLVGSVHAFVIKGT